MSPEGDRMSPEVAARLLELVSAGATILVSERPTTSPSLSRQPAGDRTVREIAAELWPGGGVAEQDAVIAGSPARRVGRGQVVQCPYHAPSFAALGIEPDLLATEGGRRAEGLAWTHRQETGADLYFLSNQRQTTRDLEVSLRATGRWPELWDAVTGERRRATAWRADRGRTRLPVRLHAHGSVFVVLREPTDVSRAGPGRNWPEPRMVARLAGGWRVSFDADLGAPRRPLVFDDLQDWTERPEPGIRYYSGTAVYERSFEWGAAFEGAGRVWLDLGQLAHLAEVTVNDVPCGVVWTAPHRVEISDALREGGNHLRIEVTNTWANRLIGDLDLPEEARLTWTTSSRRLVEDRSLLAAGLLGPVTLTAE
jgi:hypothetical protein